MLKIFLPSKETLKSKATIYNNHLDVFNWRKSSESAYVIEDQLARVGTETN